MRIPIIPFSPTHVPKHLDPWTTWQRGAEKNNEKVRGGPAERCGHQIQPRSMMLEDGEHTSPKNIPRPVQRVTQKTLPRPGLPHVQMQKLRGSYDQEANPVKKENGQADGVSTRPLVGNMLTFLDLREKFLTKHTCKPKMKSPSQNLYHS